MLLIKDSVCQLKINKPNKTTLLHNKFTEKDSLLKTKMIFI